jgi:hypothetical protein
MVRIHDLETNEIIDREMTAAEYKIYQAEEKIEADRKAEAERKAVEKQAILDRLGLTADEAKLLLG